MKIAHCQYESWNADFDHNLSRFEEGLARADAERAVVASFPECFLTGYPDTEKEARRGAFALDSEEAMRVLDVTSRHEALAIVGFNELRGDDLYNTVMVAHRGHLAGKYSKCSAYQKFHRQGRDFPVWEHEGLVFGVLICSDGGYIEPARILALKGAKVIFAPHFNAIRPAGLLSHYEKVRADHTARAIENGVYFVRGNNVILDPSKSGLSRPDAVGYGDSYVVDPGGEILVKSRRHVEDVIVAEIDPAVEPPKAWGLSKSAWSFQEFREELERAASMSGSFETPGGR
ncbi:MAG: carbon-nitrogen hydrolase family protein [Verrucomicrobiae bacterium]|nr:carbon-nitrogen hydrolase family protein [Verrucomicrobiae bacterium]